MTERPDASRWFASSRAHLRATGENYLAHLRFAGAVGALMVAAGIACLIHALVPGLFTDRATRAVDRLQAALANRPAGEALLARSDADGLLTLLVLSLAVALLPWLGKMDVAVASSLSLLSLGLPAAALRAASRGEGEDDEDGDEAPPWAGIWMPKETPALRHVAIVGGGFSGTMVAVHLAKLPGLRVTLIDRRDAPARGLAYSTEEANHLLNVRAAKMSAYPDDPGHFARWLTGRRLGGPFDFAPRRSYGAYLEEQLAGARAAAGSRLAVVTAEARDIAFGREGSTILLDNGRRIAADMVVLAGGNPPPPALSALAGLPGEFYAADPWRSDLTAGFGKDDTVLIVGTGLTMVDTLVSLTDAGFAGRIVATSRRGLLPRVHAEQAPPPFAVRHDAHLPLSRLLGAVRDRAERIGWRAAIDELRPVTPSLWKALGDVERGRFLRHLRPWWDVHRHRIAPAIADRIGALAAAGRFRVIAGSIVDARAEGERAAVRIRLRGTHSHERIEAARVVNCAGAEGDPLRAGDPLLRSLLASGAIRADRQRLGIDVGAQGEAIGADGTPTAGLYALGPIARGRDWEATAVPELRVQAAALAATVAARIGADAAA